ncbi:MAG: HEPN domain-containing protein [Pseudomonadota bacterium]
MSHEEAIAWLTRARSNLQLGRSGTGPGVLLEDLCFELQQACEKAIKAVLIHAGLPVPRVHTLGLLLQDAEAAVRIPDEVARTVELTDYAVQTRYPGEYPPVTQAEYDEAVVIAESTVTWADGIIEFQL